MVSSFAASFLQPLIGLVGGGGVTGGTTTVNGQTFQWGAFINQVITFVLTAAVIYFVVVLPLKAIAERRRRGEEAGPAAPTQLELLAEIRDLLRAAGARPGRAEEAGRHAHTGESARTAAPPGQPHQSLPQCGGRSSR